jgi:hypothetical protein
MAYRKRKLGISRHSEMTIRENVIRDFDATAEHFRNPTMLRRNRFGFRMRRRSLTSRLLQGTVLRAVHTGEVQHKIARKWNLARFLEVSTTLIFFVTYEWTQ